MSDDAFARYLLEWQPFYSTVAAAAATLTGLLFVALSINRDKLAADETRTFKRTAFRSFGDFLFVLGVAAVMLIPKEGPVSLAVTLFALGIYRLIRVGPYWTDASQRPTRSHGTLKLVREHALSVGSCLGLCGTAIAVGPGHAKALYLLVFILLELVSTASSNAWRLLMLEDTTPKADINPE